MRDWIAGSPGLAQGASLRETADREAEFARRRLTRSADGWRLVVPKRAAPLGWRPEVPVSRACARA